MFEGKVGHIWVRGWIDHSTRMVERFQMCWIPALQDSPSPEVAWVLNAVSQRCKQ
jgi:hypothetical protein